jgi:hypothetical protein
MRGVLSLGMAGVFNRYVEEGLSANYANYANEGRPFSMCRICSVFSVEAVGRHLSSMLVGGVDGGFEPLCRISRAALVNVRRIFVRDGCWG